MKYNDNGTYKDIYVKAFDTLPVGAEVDYDGQTVPDGWTEILNIQPDVYSETETICGTYKGKPLYRKIIQIQNPSAISASGIQSQPFPHNISNLKECINIINPRLTTSPDDPTVTIVNLPYIASSGSVSGISGVTNEYIYFKSNNHAWSTSYYLKCILEYTKTTD